LGSLLGSLSKIEFQEMPNFNKKIFWGLVGTGLKLYRTSVGVKSIHFHPSLIFVATVGKLRNIRIGCKLLAVANTLAYYTAV
jgi:hypothetical protein